MLMFMLNIWKKLKMGKKGLYRKRKGKKSIKKAKDLNSLVFLLQNRGIMLTKIHLKILYQINKFKEGIGLKELSKKLKMDRGNLSKYVNYLISQGVLEEIGKNPKIVKISSIEKMERINLVKCKKCHIIHFIPKTYDSFRCKKCGRLIVINRKNIVGEIEEKTYEKLKKLCFFNKKDINKTIKDMVDLYQKYKIG